MTKPVKLTVLGGSGVATPELARVLAAAEERPPMDVVLHGRSAGKLERVAGVSTRAASGAAVPLRLSHTTDLDEALDGADYVLEQIRVGGYRARAYDESFPHAFGLPGEETFGPGGMNNALRTIPVVLEHCRAIERVAPGALLINLTNPSSYIQYAVERYSRVRVLGVCDAPLGLARGVASLLGVRPNELWVGYVGMHHFGWITELRRHGRDVMPEVMARLESLPGLPVDADIVRALGAIPSPYFKYYYHPDRMLAKQRGQPTRAEQLIQLETRMMVDYADPSAPDRPASLAERGAHWYEDIVVPVMLAHACDSRRTFILNLRNGSTVPWVPPDAIVEIPALVARQGFYPLEPPRASPDIQAMVRLNAAFEMLWVEAVVERSYDKALRAMAMNHLIQTLDQARAVLNHIWPGDQVP